MHLAVASRTAQSSRFKLCFQEPWESVLSPSGLPPGREKGRLGSWCAPGPSFPTTLQQSRCAHICLMSFCHYLGLLVRGQQPDRLTAVGGEHRDSKKNEGCCRNLPACVKGGPDQKVDGRDTREAGSDLKTEPVGLVTTSLDVREQGGGLRNRTKAVSLKQL